MKHRWLPCLLSLVMVQSIAQAGQWNLANILPSRSQVGVIITAGVVIAGETLVPCAASAIDQFICSEGLEGLARSRCENAVFRFSGSEACEGVQEMGTLFLGATSIGFVFSILGNMVNLVAKAALERRNR